MVKAIGIAKEVIGSVVVKTTGGIEKIVNVGDELFLGEEILTQTADSKLVLITKSGKELVVLGDDEVILDGNFIVDVGDNNIVADVDRIQKTILDGENLDALEETAAGANMSANEATSSTGAKFSDSGSISNVFESYGDLSGDVVTGEIFNTSSPKFAPIEGSNEVAENEFRQEQPRESFGSQTEGIENSTINISVPNSIETGESDNESKDISEPIVSNDNQNTTTTGNERYQPSVPSESIVSEKVDIPSDKPSEPVSDSEKNESVTPTDEDTNQIPTQTERGGETETPNKPNEGNTNEPISPLPTTPETGESNPSVTEPEPVQPSVVEPTLNIRVENIVPKLDTDLSKYESQMGLQSKFFYLPPEGEAYIRHSNDDTNGWTLHSFQNIDQALDFASQGKVDATYQVKKIDFQSHKDEDLAKNTATSLEDSPLARFLGDNAHSLKAAEGTDYAVGRNEAKGERSLNIMEGYLFLEKDKDYRFKSVSDDGIRIKIGDKILFNDEEALKGHHDRTMSKEDTYQVDETGFYKMDIAHYDIGYGNATLKLFTIEDGKELTVGDYKNGGIPLFTDITDIGYVDGKIGKITGYEAEITIDSNLEEGKEINVSVTDKNGDVLKIADVVAQPGEKTVIKHEFDKLPDEQDVFKAEHKNSEGQIVVSDTTDIKESDTVITNSESVIVGGKIEVDATNDSSASNDTIDTSNISTVSQNSEIGAPEFIPTGILVESNANDTIAGLESSGIETNNEVTTTASENMAVTANADNNIETGTIVIPVTNDDINAI